MKRTGSLEESAISRSLESHWQKEEYLEQGKKREESIEVQKK